MLKINLKDTYFSVPIHRDHQKWLHFQWQDHEYQFHSLAFGLSSAPRCIHKDHTHNSGMVETTGSETDCIHR